MGCGKSSVAKQLSKQLGFLELDTDTAIEQLTGQSIPELFANKGEQNFRAQETRITKFLNSLDRIVVATGGGLPIYNDNMNHLLRTGLTIYLACDEETLAERIRKDQRARPLHAKSKNLVADITQRLNSRKPIYNEAHLVIDANNTVQNIVGNIIDKIKGSR